MTREQLYAFNRMCNEIPKILEVDRQWLPLIRRWLWNWLNFLGQHHLFSKLENSIITDAARREVELLIVPVKPNMQINELLARITIPNIIFGGLVINDNLINAAEQFKATRRNYRTFYNSWVYLIWQARIVEKYSGLIRERIPYGTVQYLTLGATETGELVFTQKLQEKFAKQTSWMSLPEHTRLDKIGDSTQDWLLELMQLPRIERYEKSLLTAVNVERDLRDEFRRLTKTEKGRIEAETISLDVEESAHFRPLKELESADGSNVSMLEFLTVTNESLHTQTSEQLFSKADPCDELVEQIKEAHGDDVSETAKVYFEIYFKQDGPGKKVKQQQVARASGKNRKTISRHIKKIENFLREKVEKN